MSVIEINNLEKSYGAKNVLRGLNLTIEKGEFWGLIGKNGAGKSTLINILCGTVIKTSGGFRVMGIDDTSIDKAKVRMGIMPDVSELFGDMSGLEFMEYMMALKGHHIRSKDILALFEKVDLGVSLKTKIKTYSFGMKKKIAIAQAIADTPEILILDEPTSGVDPESILHLQNLFEKLNQGGTTIFMASHNLDEVSRICSHISILDRGQFQVQGELQSVINEHTAKIRLQIQCTTPDDFNTSELCKRFTILEASHSSLTFEVKSQDDIPQIVHLLTEQGVSIFSVIPHKATLEEIFMS